MSEDRVTEILKRSKGLTNEVVGVLIETLVKEDKATTRRDAARALGNMGKKARGAILVLGQLSIKDPDAEVRRYALESLQKIVAVVGIVEELPEILPALQEMILKDPVSALRAEAILATHKMGFASKELIEILQKAQKDSDKIVQTHANTVLSKLKPS
ncbi:MAG: HEAT repeat domain-containing protein [Planctomycetota bacterium]